MTNLLDIARYGVCVVAAGCVPFLIEAWKKDRLLAGSLGMFLSGAMGVELATIGTGLSRFTAGEVLFGLGVLGTGSAVAVDVYRHKRSRE